MKKIFATILMMAILVPVFADGDKDATKTSAKAKAASAVLIGLVIDQETGEALPGVQVKVNGEEQVVYTDFDGNFEITGLNSGSVSLDFSLVSYDQNQIRDLVVKPEVQNALKIELKR